MNEPNRTDINVIFSLSMIHFIGDFYFSFVNPLLPVFVEKHALSLTQVGFFLGLTHLPARDYFLDILLPLFYISFKVSSYQLPFIYHYHYGIKGNPADRPGKI